MRPTEREATEHKEPMSEKAVGRSDLRLVRANLEIEVRRSILAAAAAILSQDGPSALTLRRVADAVNASTKVIYTHFGNKDGLLAALYLESFAGLGVAFERCQDIADPIARLRTMAIAYRAYGKANPALYNIMFGDLGRTYEAPLESRRQAWRTFETLRGAVIDCLARAKWREAENVTRLLWAAMHGIVSLELRGLLGRAVDGERLIAEAVDAVIKARQLVPQPAG